ncbi:MAG TPA: cytochrome c oxidase, cbb3-type, CcoQ subunit [Sulfurimonas sp. UBA12504]|nr:MAG: cytochrome c oxidase, cbb3-type, CcoQ subunit [Sulfurimonas sp. GWF2_37_8]DAB30711.1 MAG TPA: cytochrome c oxidase, cbb3-type, CcoQ subunit [Sulfurimonas sp. UBA12504]
MNIAELQAYGYFALTVFMVLVLYGYIYHLYSKKEDADGHDYEEYSNIALRDDVTDTPVSAISDDKEK